MAGKVVRIYDYEKRSREPDAAGPRDPTEADAVVVLPFPTEKPQPMKEPRL